jgi:VWFA-related protein
MMGRRLLMAACLACGADAQGPPPVQTFRAQVQGVSVTVAVHQGRRGVSGLRAEDFELTDNGVPQRITSVTVESTPIDLTLVIDTSSSISGDMVARFVADVEGLERLLGEDDRAALVTFSSSVRAVSPLHARDEPARPAEIAPAGSTAFYHAVVAGLLAKTTAGRPNLVLVMSDGGDNVSLLDGEDVKALARQSENVLYVVLRGSPQGAGSRVGWLPFRGPGRLDALKEAAALTGGEVRQQDRDASVATLFKRVLDDFKASYVLRYTPEGVTPRGWHELAVKVKDRPYTVRARRGYFAG